MNLESFRFYDTYVAEGSFECKSEEIDWGQVQDREHTGQFTEQSKAEHKRLPNQEEEPEDEAKMKQCLHS